MVPGSGVIDERLQPAALLMAYVPGLPKAIQRVSHFAHPLLVVNVFHQFVGEKEALLVFRGLTKRLEEPISNQMGNPVGIGVQNLCHFVGRETRIDQLDSKATTTEMDNERRI